MTITIKQRPLFCRPIEILASTQITFPAPVGAVTLDAGVYANIYTLANSIENEADDASVEVLVSGDTLKIGIYLSGGGAVTFGSAGSDIADILGYDSDISGAGAGSVTEADYLSSHIWLPTYQYANQGAWHPVIDDVFSGNMANTGQVAGEQGVTRLYYRAMKFVHEPAENVAEEFATDSYMPARCWDRFNEAALVSYPEENNVCCKGFWYWENCQDVLDTSVRSYGGTDWYRLSDLMSTAGGIHFNYDSSPDEYVFCNFMTHRNRREDKSSLPAARLRYTIDTEFHTVEDVPTWTYQEPIV